MGRLRFCSHCCQPAALFAVDLVQGLEEKTSSLLFEAMAENCCWVSVSFECGLQISGGMRERAVTCGCSWLGCKSSTCVLGRSLGDAECSAEWRTQLELSQVMARDEILRTACFWEGRN